jgi:Fur family ferric uptake transcriptional regulator
MTHDTMRWEARLGQAGARVTRQRSIILDAVCAGAGHTTLGEVLVRVRGTDRSINRSTVYRSLHALTAAGVIVETTTADGETAYEIAREDPHHHLRCLACGGEQEVGGGDLESLTRAMLDRYGFRLELDHLVLAGICRQCSAGRDGLSSG